MISRDKPSSKKGLDIIISSTQEAIVFTGLNLLII